MDSLTKQLKEMESYFPLIDKKKESVSKTTIAWQIDHSLRVVNSVCKAMEISNESDFKPQFKILKTFFLTVKWFPRGKAKAPKVVKSEEIITLEDLERRIGYAKSNLLKIKELEKNAHFSHPYFGHLNLNESTRFLQTHTNHHLKIIRDIIRK